MSIRLQNQPYSRLKLKRAQYNKNNKLRQFNNILSILIFGLALYIMFAPFAPQLALYINRFTDKTDGFKYQSVLADKLDSKVGESLPPPPTDNHLVIPKIGVDSTVYQGNDISLLDKGLWHRPNTSTPEQGSNTVIVAHRFQYTQGPATFYSLDKLAIGDKAIVFWGNADNRFEYDYEAIEVKVVPATAIEIEEPTTEETLTLYTCTPLWTSKDRLVVTFKVIGKTKL